MTFGADGSKRFESAGGSVTLNAPTADPDPGDPVRDSLDVARRVIAAIKPGTM